MDRDQDGKPNLTEEDIARLSGVRADAGVPDRPKLTPSSSDGHPRAEEADHVIAPDPLDEVRPVAACLPNDADDQSDAGMGKSDHPNEGWRAERLSKP